MLLSCHSFDILLDTTINKQLGTFQLQALFKINAASTTLAIKLHLLLSKLIVMTWIKYELYQ